MIRTRILERRYVFAAAGVILACLLGLAAYLGLTGAGASGSRSPAGLYRSAKSLARQSDCAGAIQRFARALITDPGYVSAYVGEANCYRSMGSYGQAITAYSQAIKADPGNPDLYIGRSAMYQLNGQSGYASSDCFTAEKRSVPTIVTINQIATCFGNVQDYGGEAAALKRGLVHFPTNSDLYRSIVGIDETTGDTSAALADAKKAYEYASTPAQRSLALSVSGDIYASQGEYPAAIRVYKQASSIAPFVLDPWVGRAGALVTEGKTEPATDVYESAERVPGMSTGSRALLYRAHGNMLMQTGHQKAAARAWQKALHYATDPALRSDLRRALTSVQS